MIQRRLFANVKIIGFIKTRRLRSFALAFIEVSFGKRVSLLCFIEEYGAGPVRGHGGALQPRLHALIALLHV
jgi:hypothetical protein